MPEIRDGALYAPTRYPDGSTGPEMVTVTYEDLGWYLAQAALGEALEEGVA